MSTHRTRPGHARLIPLAVILLLSFSLALPALGAEEPGKIRRLGNPVTAFSTTPADSLAELQSQFNQFRSDIEDVLRQAGWDGDPRDLFAAVERGDVERVQVPVGEPIHWMGFRRHKKPVVKQNLVWAGKEPFDAWKIEFESANAVHTFLVPVVCLNLSYSKKGPAYPPPSCSLAADVGQAACGKLPEIRLTGSTDGKEIAITGVRGPGGAGDPAQAMATGTGRWTYKPTAAGGYEFAAVCTSGHGKTATASAKASVPEPEPCVECRLAATYDESIRTFTVDAGGSIGDVEITGITLPDGTAGNVGDLQAGGTGRWTYSPKMRRKPGDYTYAFAARATHDGATKDCNASVTVNVPKPEQAWILRLFGARIEGDDSLFTSEFLPNGANERNHLSFDSGDGFGLAIERLFTRRLGAELGVIFGDLDTRLMRDIDEAWETAEDAAGFMPITLGLNFHLTPDSKVDFYLGPFMALVQFDDVEYRVLGDHVVADIEDDFTFGAQLGIDVPTASRWAFNAAVRYIDTEAELKNLGFGGFGSGDDDRPELAIDPLIYSVGVAFRF